MKNLGRDEVEALGADFDLEGKVAQYLHEMRVFAYTEGVPAPSAHPLVEEIVSQHAGQFRILEETVRAGRDLFVEMDVLTANHRKMAKREADVDERFKRIEDRTEATENMRDELRRTIDGAASQGDLLKKEVDGFREHFYDPVNERINEQIKFKTDQLILLTAALDKLSEENRKIFERLAIAEAGISQLKAVTPEFNELKLPDET